MLCGTILVLLLYSIIYGVVECDAQNFIMVFRIDILDVV
jgi:hypothetical protein